MDNKNLGQIEMNYIDDDPLKIKQQLRWFKDHFQGIGCENLSIVNTIIKRIIFIKVSTAKSDRFMNSVIYDALCCLNNIKVNHTRYFYFSYRSLIENVARCCLEKSADDETRITPLFQALRDKLSYHQVYSQDIYSDFMKEYSDACGYIHNNQASGLNVMLSYSKIMEPEPLTSNEIKSLLNQLLSLLENSIRALSLCRKEDMLRNIGRNHLFIPELLPKTISCVFVPNLSQ